MMFRFLLSVAYVGIAVCGIGMGIVACSLQEQKQHAHAKINGSSELLHPLFYVKDQRTGICFATSNPGVSTGLLTSVTCTPEVEKLINGN